MRAFADRPECADNDIASDDVDYYNSGSNDVDHNIVDYHVIDDIVDNFVYHDE